MSDWKSQRMPTDHFTAVDPRGEESFSFLDRPKAWQPPEPFKNVVFIKFKRLSPNAKIPSYVTPGSAGCDFVTPTDITLKPGERQLVKLGFAVAIPEGYEGQVRPRSGLALNHGVTVLNSPGTVDSDYRGEMGVILHNTSMVTYKCKAGERVCQMVVSPVTQAMFLEVDELDETSRGAGGFGSTGK